MQFAAELRRAAGLAVPDPASTGRRALVELTGATLAAIGGAPLDVFVAPLPAWEADIGSLQEARADLAAVRATLELRLGDAGATPTLNRLVQALVAGQIARLDPSSKATDRLSALAGRRPRPVRRRRPGRRPERRVRPPIVRRRTRRVVPRAGVLPLLPWWPAVAAAAAVTAWLSLAPATPEIALLPNGRVPPSAPLPHGGPAAPGGAAGPAAPAPGSRHLTPGGTSPAVETEVVTAAVLPLSPSPPASPAGAAGSAQGAGSTSASPAGAPATPTTAAAPQLSSTTSSGHGRRGAARQGGGVGGPRRAGAHGAGGRAPGHRHE